MRQSNFWHSQPPTITSMFLNGQAIPLDALERPEILQLLPSYEGKTVLDLAAGIGRFTGDFAKQAKKVVSLDFSPHFLEANKQANGSHSNIEWLCCNAMDAAFQPHAFDLIFVSWLFMYLDTDEVSLLSQRLLSWLQPQGTLFFRESCAATSSLHAANGYSAHYRSPREYDRLFKHWPLVKHGNIQAYEDLLADPFKCYWIYRKP